MIKKTYLAILSIAIVAVLLGSLFYNVTFADRPIQAAQVEITNFPSEQNVTITSLPTPLEPTVIMVVQNHTLTTADYSKVFAKANIEGYKYVSIFVTYYRPYNNAPIIRVEPSCLNITSGSDGAGSNHAREITTSQLTARWEQRASIGFEAGAPYLGFRSYVDNDSIELTIVLYCYN